MSPLDRLAREIESAIIGRGVGRIFQISESAIALDMIPHAGSYLLVDYGRRPQAFLMVRKMKQVERESVHLSLLAIEIKRALGDGLVRSVRATAEGLLITLGLENDLISLIIDFRPGGSGISIHLLEVSTQESLLLAVSAPDSNLTKQVGQISLPADVPDGMSLSHALDARYQATAADQAFDRLAASTRRSIGKETTKAKRLLENIDGDIRKHGDAETWKKFGDLILANLANLRREAESFVLTDYFDPAAPEIVVPADENRTPTEVAEEYFKRYTRARNAADQSAKRRESAVQALAGLERRKQEVEKAIKLRDEEFLLSVEQPKRVAASAAAVRADKKRGKVPGIPQARRFAASLGFEILVGKKAADNDHLTFRIARSNDLWLHAADYPGSHVIVRNSSKAELPQKVLLEAARLAAFYSDAREMPKAAVNYTERKFVQKPKRAAPGMVSLSKFRTILVEPGVPESVLKT